MKDAYRILAWRLSASIFLLNSCVELRSSLSQMIDDSYLRTSLFWQSKDAEVMLKLGSTPDKREQYRLMRDEMEKRFIRVTRGSIVGGVRLGMFTAAFCVLQNLLAEKRGVHDVFNVVGAGSATAATFGLISKKLTLIEKTFFYLLFNS